MKYVLHKNVLGKFGINGKTYFQVYISFTVNRQTYRFKSQLVSRLVTQEEFDKLKSVYENEKSDLLDKEIEILSYCIKKNTHSNGLDRNQLRLDYIFLCSNIIDTLLTMRNAIEVSDWSAKALGWELTKKFNVEDELIRELSCYAVNDQLLFELTVQLMNFQLFSRKKGYIDGLFLMYDWGNGYLRENFEEYLNEQLGLKQTEKLMSLINKLIK